MFFYLEFQVTILFQLDFVTWDNYIKNKQMRYSKILFSSLLGVFLLFSNQDATAQSRRSKKSNTTQISPQLHESVQYRSIGPFRGGRSAAVVGVANQPKVFYFGATGGGVWKTVDGGETYKNISDGYFGGSIGSVAVAPSDPNILYVGGGEVT
jgi:hypothetical protein